MVGARKRASFRDAKGKFASPKSKGVRVYRGRKQLHGGERAKEIRRAKGPRKNTGNISRGFPRGYTSPFRAFIVPVSHATEPERAFALIEIISRRKYEGTAYKNWIPFDLGFMPSDVAQELDETDVKKQFALSTLKGKNELSKVFGFFMLKPEDERREALTPRLMRLIKYRAQHGNEETKGLPGRPGKRKRKGKRHK